TLPYLPRIVGVVTSPTGAVIRDILHRLADRCPCHVLVWPVRVQGETCAAEVAGAIAGFNALVIGAAAPRPDPIIVARRGGKRDPAYLSGRARDRLDHHRPCCRLAGADADRCGRARRSGAYRATDRGQELWRTHREQFAPRARGTSKSLPRCRTRAPATRRDPGAAAPAA